MPGRSLSLRLFGCRFAHSWPSAPFWFVGRVRASGSITVFTSFLFRDPDRPDHAGRFRPRQVDREQSMLQVGLLHLHAVRQHEGALELPGGDASMQVLPALVVLLASPEAELFLLDVHLACIEVQ